MNINYLLFMLIDKQQGRVNLSMPSLQIKLCKALFSDFFGIVCFLCFEIRIFVSLGNCHILIRGFYII